MALGSPFPDQKLLVPSGLRITGSLGAIRSNHDSDTMAITSKTGLFAQTFSSGHAHSGRTNRHSVTPARRAALGA